ncbi:uncharacterized protein LOC113331035 isoform X2 [Papaver somniferum]|uniref:uncharacterized protein LOC113331035 isoform X2 n=1 Tax=Papaver somniferum TaxID=3469 RepID=UPI000E703182|nr:uncharacterized protein LOC113331035 isoform X2 [Papaver somniferum]
MHNCSPATEITLSGDLHLFPLDNGSDLVTSKTDSINVNLSDEKEVITVFNSIKAIETGISWNRKLFTTDLSDDSSGATIYNSFYAEMDDDSDDLVNQVSSADLSLSLEYVDYWLARNFLACWIFFYMSELLASLHLRRLGQEVHMNGTG